MKKDKIKKPPSPKGVKGKKDEPLWLKILVFVIGMILLGGIYVVKTNGESSGGPAEVDLTEIVRFIDAGDVASANIDDFANVVTVTLQDEREFTSTYPMAYGREITTKLLDASVDLDVPPIPEPNPFWQEILLTVIRIGLIAILLGFVLWKSGMLKAINDKVKTQAEVPETRFSDVAGADEAVQEMQEVVEFLKDGERFRAVGARVPKGVLLTGPPGTGKTLLARAVAGESGVPFFATAGSDFVEVYAGRGAARIRALFGAAIKAGKESGGAIIFIDEIDQAGRARSNNGGDDGNLAEAGGTLNALLNQMDGFEQNNVIVIGATNLPNVMDAALMRRLERRIEVPLPDRVGRTKILKVHAKGRPFAPDIDWDEFGRGAFGMSGAEMELVINEACMEAAREGVKVVTLDHLNSALGTTQVGRARKSAVVTERDKEITAWHEAGHALVCMVEDAISDPTYVTIVPRGASGGHTRPGGSDHMFSSRSEIQARLAMAMGGRAAESILLKGDFTDGAGGDLIMATDLATQYVAKYGMLSTAGGGLMVVSDESLRLGSNVGADVNRQVSTLLNDRLGRAHDILVDHEDALADLAEILLREESIGSDVIQKFRQRWLAKDEETLVSVASSESAL